MSHYDIIIRDPRLRGSHRGGLRLCPWARHVGELPEPPARLPVISKALSGNGKAGGWLWKLPDVASPRTKPEAAPVTPTEPGISDNSRQLRPPCRHLQGPLREREGGRVALEAPRRGEPTDKAGGRPCDSHGAGDL